MVVMEALFVISQLIDMIWVGKLGSTAIAGVGIANIVVMMIMAMDLGVITGVRAIIARHVGAGDMPGASRIAAQSILIGFTWGLLMMLLGLVIARPIMELMDLEAAVMSDALRYMHIVLYGWPVVDGLLICLYSMQSSGDTIRPMIIEGIMRIIHVSLCPLLVLGIWGFPRLEVGGAALSNVISQIIGFIIVSFVLFSGRTRLRPKISDLRFQWRTIVRVFRIGIPALVMHLQRSIGNFLLTFLIAPFGTVPVAAHSLTSRVEMFVLMPGMAMGSGAGVLVGQNLGAHRPERSEKSAWMAILILQLFLVLACGAVAFWAETVMKLFTDEPELLQVGATFIRIASPGFFLMGFTAILQNCLASAGDTVPNMIISLIMLWIVQLPLAWFLPGWTNLGVLGIRWAIVAANAAGSILYVIYFRRGRWKLKKV